MPKNLQDLPVVSVHIQSRVTLSAATRFTDFGKAIQVLATLRMFGHETHVKTFQTFPDDLKPDEYIVQFEDGRFAEVITQ